MLKAEPRRNVGVGFRLRSAYRERIIGALTEAGFTLAGDPVKRDESSFFSAELFYPSLFATGPSLRPHIRVEMSLRSSRRSSRRGNSQPWSVGRCLTMRAGEARQPVQPQAALQNDGADA